MQNSDGVSGALIRLQRVSRRHRRRADVVDALRDISLEIPGGCFAALMGPSGSGKSTLLNLISGIDRATAGDVEVAGRTLGTLNPIVVDMRRRLRLNPREAMSFDVRLDRSDFGRMLRTNKIDTIEFSAMAVLDPNPRADGGVDRGLLGDRSWHHHMQR